MNLNDNQNNVHHIIFFISFSYVYQSSSSEQIYRPLMITTRARNFQHAFDTILINTSYFKCCNYILNISTQKTITNSNSMSSFSVDIFSSILNVYTSLSTLKSIKSQLSFMIITSTLYVFLAVVIHCVLTFP